MHCHASALGKHACAYDTGDTGPARRAEHFFTETARVAEGAALWDAGDIAAFGALMNASGRSSAVNYEVSRPRKHFGVINCSLPCPILTAAAVLLSNTRSMPEPYIRVHCAPVQAAKLSSCSHCAHSPQYACSVVVLTARHATLSAHRLQVGSPQLKFLQSALQSCDGVYGARFSGAGTRGACVALIKADAAEHVAAEASIDALPALYHCFSLVPTLVLLYLALSL